MFSSRDFALADIDADGNLDLVACGNSNAREMHVYFGDGAGHFPRFQSVNVARVREVDVDPADLATAASGPRDIQFGQFVRQGRTEIVTTTGEGDLVVLAYEKGRFREVLRRSTDFLGARVFVGNFLQPGKTDLLLTGSSASEGIRLPRFFEATPTPVIAPDAPAGRMRAVRGVVQPSPTDYRVQIQGADCVPANDLWSFTREGVFGVQRTPERVVEMAHKNNEMVVRFTAPWALTPVEVSLDLSIKGHLAGLVTVNTTCGSHRLKLTVAPE
jgi:hypothetical protein